MLEVRSEVRPLRNTCVPAEAFESLLAQAEIKALGVALIILVR